MGTQISLKTALAIGLGAAAWFCPLWLTPTPSIPAWLWGGVCLGLWLTLDAANGFNTNVNRPLQKLFWLLLGSLAGVIAWRSQELQNALAAALCLASIGLAAVLAAKSNQSHVANTLACGWLLAGLVNAVVGLAQYFGQTAEPLGIAFGFLRQRNHLSTLCNIAWLSLLYLWTQHIAQSTKIKIACHFFACLSCVALTAALAATCSRAGLLELTVSLIVSLVYAVTTRHRQLLLAVAFTVCCYVFWAYTLPLLSGSPESILGRIVQTTAMGSDGADAALQDSRRLLWSNTLSVIQTQPLLGVGWRELALSLRTTDFGLNAAFEEQADNAHNLPLQFAAELGVPFTVLWFGLAIWLLIQNKPWQTRVPAQFLAWGIMASIGIHSLLEYPLWYAPFQIALGLSAGLAFSQGSPATILTLPSKRMRMGQGLAGIAFICFCIYAAFDYHRMRQLFITDDERAMIYREGTYIKAEASWLFAAHVRFAKFVTTPVTSENAKQMKQLGQQVLHFSPEPLVFKKLQEIDAHTLK